MTRMSWLHLLSLVALSLSILVPTTPPDGAAPIDPALLSLSLEFFAFPGYTSLSNTAQCLMNIQNLRGTPPAVRIGGTTQDRATYNATETMAVRYRVANPTLAPLSLTYGPDFFVLASQLKGGVTIGLNRQLNNESNTFIAAEQALKTMSNLISIELGNEPDLYSRSSPIVPPGQTWSPTVDAAIQQEWHRNLRNRLNKPLGQAGVYLSYPQWSTAGLIPMIPDALDSIVSFSGHSYPQSACGGAKTDLQALQDHSKTVSYTSKYRTEASAAHSVGKNYYLGETNSATCGGGGISPTFGAALWVMDYSLQAALVGVDRVYFHQGTLAKCAYCLWTQNIVQAPYYGAFFLSEALGTDGHSVAMLDTGTSTTAVYAVYGISGEARRVLVINTAYYNGTGTRSATTILLTGLNTAQSIAAQRLTAPAATTTVTTPGNPITLAGQSFTADCVQTGPLVNESVAVAFGSASVKLKASEALLLFLR